MQTYYNGMGDAASDIVSGAADASSSLLLGAQNFFSAEQQVAASQAAARAGLTLDQYLAATQGSRSIAAASSVSKGTLLGLPTWVWFAAGMFFLLSVERPHHR